MQYLKTLPNSSNSMNMFHLYKRNPYLNKSPKCPKLITRKSNKKFTLNLPLELILNQRYLEILQMIYLATQTRFSIKMINKKYSHTNRMNISIRTLNLLPLTLQNKTLVSSIKNKMISFSKKTLKPRVLQPGTNKMPFQIKNNLHSRKLQTLIINIHIVEIILKHHLIFLTTLVQPNNKHSSSPPNKTICGQIQKALTLWILHLKRARRKYQFNQRLRQDKKQYRKYSTKQISKRKNGTSPMTNTSREFKVGSEGVS